MTVSAADDEAADGEEAEARRSWKSVTWDPVAEREAGGASNDEVGSATSPRKREDSVYNLLVMREYLKNERTKAPAPEDTSGSRCASAVSCLKPIHPVNKCRITWDCILLVLIFFMGITVPIDLALVGLTGSAWQAIEICMVVFFSIDIILNFNTAYYDTYGNLRTDRYDISKRYVQTWFLLDFCSTFPFDMVLTASTFKGASMMRLPRVVKMARLARLMRLARIRSLLQRVFGLHLVTNMVVIFTVRFISLFAALLLVTHWLACIFCALANWEEETSVVEEIYGDSPPSRMVGWEFDGTNAMDLRPQRRYYVAFYFAFCSLFLMKPADITFRTSYCRYFFMLLGFIKPVVGASIMGVLTQMIVSQNNKRGTLQLKMQSIGVFMQKKKIPVYIQQQVLAYLEHAERQVETLQDVDAIKTLSPTLRDEVAYSTNHRKICTCALFECAFGMSFVRRLCSLLQLELYGPDDVVCQEGHFITFMAFVNTGCLKLFKMGDVGDDEDGFEEGALETRRTDRLVRSMSLSRSVHLCGEVGPGNTFGIQAVLVEAEYRTPTTVLCFHFSELSILRREDLLKTVDRNPQWTDTLVHIRHLLNQSDDLEGLLADFADADPAKVQALLRPASCASGWQMSAEKENSYLGRRSRGALASLTRRSTMEGGLPETGFTTITMTPMERHVITEVKTVRSGVANLVQSTEDRLLRRICLGEERLEAHLVDLEDRLWTLLPEDKDALHDGAQSSQGAGPSSRLARLRAEAAAKKAAREHPGGSSGWVVVESPDAAVGARRKLAM